MRDAGVLPLAVEDFRPPSDVECPPDICTEDPSPTHSPTDTETPRPSASPSRGPSVRPTGGGVEPTPGPRPEPSGPSSQPTVVGPTVPAAQPSVVSGIFAFGDQPPPPALPLDPPPPPVPLTQMPPAPVVAIAALLFGFTAAVFHGLRSKGAR